MNRLGNLRDYILAAASTDSAFAVATVATVTPAGATDGNALVTVSWLGTTAYATYGDHYTPEVGHVVLMARTQPLAIICRLVGTPPT